MFIDKIKIHIPDLIENYDTLGINSFYETFPDVDAVIFYDKPAAPKKQIDNLIVTDLKNEAEVLNQKNVELYKVVTNRYEFSHSQGILNFYYFTSSMAINWAYLKGYKNVVLCGVDLVDNSHFDDKNHKPVIAEGVMEKSKKHIEDLCLKYINIFQLNPESDLKVPKITIDKLLKGKANGRCECKY